MAFPEVALTSLKKLSCPNLNSSCKHYKAIGQPFKCETLRGSCNSVEVGQQLPAIRLPGLLDSAPRRH